MTSSIGSGGGVITIPGILTLTIPASALSTTTSITIRPSASVLFGKSSLSSAWIFEPAGLQFSIPAELEFFTPSGFTGITTGAQIHWGATPSEALPLTTTATTNGFKASVDHFTVGFLAIPTPGGVSAAACTVRGAGRATIGCSGVDAGFPDPWPVEVGMECSTFSPTPSLRPRPKVLSSGFGLGVETVQGITFNGYGATGTLLNSTPATVYQTFLAQPHGADFIQSAGGGLVFASLSNATRPGEPMTTNPHNDLRLFRSNASGQMVQAAVIVDNDQRCPPVADGGMPGAFSRGDVWEEPRIVQLATGPFVAWMERWTPLCNTSSAPLVKIRGVWLNDDLTVRVGPVDLTDQYTESVSQFALATEGNALVGVAYVMQTRVVPPPQYGEARVKFRAFIDGQQTTATPTTIAGHPCPDQLDPSGLAPAQSINLPDGGTQCLGTVSWQSISAAAKRGLAFVAFNTSSGPVHFAVVKLEAGASANDVVARLEYPSITARRYSLVSSSTGFSLAGLVPSIYLNTGALTPTPLPDGGAPAGAGVVHFRMTDDLQFAGSLTYAGVAQYGINEPVQVATSGGVSLLGWTDAPNPVMGVGAVRVRQKASIVDCP